MAKSSPPPVERAFTLIELLVVIAGIGILLGIAVPSFNWAFERAKVDKRHEQPAPDRNRRCRLYLNDKNGVLPGIERCTWVLARTAIPVIYPKYIADQKSFSIAF